MGNIFSTLFGVQIVNNKVEEKEIEELPIEVQFKILQYLSYEELFNMKQTNHYFYELINKHKNVLARKRFKYLFFAQTLVSEMLCTMRSLRERDLLKQNIESIDFALNRRRQKKWISALKKQISVLLTNNTSDNGNIMLMGSTIIFNDKGNIHIATAKNVTKVSCIQFRCENWPRSQLIVKGKEVKPYNNIKKYFEITNIHDSKMVFSILWLLNEDDNNLLKFIQIIYFTEIRDMFNSIIK
ncbi:F-box domain-containing protein [Meloidogyne graminicola]|uniref:F-box domain-containing protein n=1 Tax=Meloidogyne graminicola TaxID=189291 RepID=A0A8S9ZA65_9BILA|nr:F-box domain-containing protein [Meloidogyne graminicola]